MLKFPGVLGCCILLLLAMDNAEITVRVAIGGSFRLHIFKKNLAGLANCTLTNPQNVNTDIPLNYQGGNSETEHEKIVPLGNDQCGARIRNANSSDAGRWTLTLSNATAETMTQVFRVVPMNLETPVNRTSTAVIGASRTTIFCGPSSILYCEMRDPLGNVAPLSSRTRCETILEIVKATDFGVWNCIVGVTGSVSEIHATHTLNIEDPAEEVKIFANETLLGNLISWEVHRIIPAASWCRAFPPHGESILVAPGLEVEKYASVGTDFTANKCGLFINGEFSEKYHGTWRLEMGLTSGRIIGGFIKMPEGKMPEANAGQASSKKPVEINVPAEKSFTITCQTEYPAGYCWIRGPQGQIITSTEELTLGRCSHVVNNAMVAAHNGTWTCNMAHIHGGHEEHLITEVNVLEKLFRAVIPETIIRRGDRTVIACKSVFHSPLQYCRFVRPDGVGLGVTPGMEPSGRYSYEGDGLDHGYCGLAISSVESVDIGEWTCVSRSRFHTWETENFDISVLRLPETSTASVIGLTMGSVLLLAIVAVVVIVRYRRNKTPRNSEAPMIVEYNTS